MTKPLRVLFVEDSEDDALLLLREFHRGDYDVSWKRVESADEFRAELADWNWELVLADFSLPGFSGREALEMLRTAGTDVPYIMVSGELGEEVAIESLHAGAHDFVPKGKLTRLLPAVERELKEARHRADHRRSERYFKCLIEHSTDVISILDKDGVALYESPSITRIMGYEPEELVGNFVLDMIHPDDLPGAMEILQRALDDPTCVPMAEYRARHKDGTWKILASTVNNRLHDPAVRGLVVNSRDVTEARQAEAALQASEAQLRQAQRMEAVGRLAGGIAHDYNNMLTAIGGTAQLLLQQARPGHPFRDDLLEITTAVDRAASLTRQLLAFSRQQVIQPKPLQLNEVVAETEKMLRRLIGEDVELRASLAPALPLIEADPGQLSQLLLNLVVNARDAMPDGGVVTLQTRRQLVQQPLQSIFGEIDRGEYAHLSVSDTGVGIDREVLPYIFDPFFTTKAVGRGTGLGLSTVYGIVQQCNAFLVVHTEPGRGSTFEVYFPALRAAAEVTPEPGAEPAREARGETILVTEDEPALRKLIRRILQAQGYTVLLAADGQEALQMADQHPDPIDLLLTDVIMPGINGRQLAEQLTVLRPSMRVLYMSGYTEDAVVQRGIRNHEVELLPKPFTLEGLAQKVREVMDR